MLYILPEVDDVDHLAEAATNNLELLKKKDEAEGILGIRYRYYRKESGKTLPKTPL